MHNRITGGFISAVYYLAARAHKLLSFADHAICVFGMAMALRCIETVEIRAFRRWLILAATGLALGGPTSAMAQDIPNGVNQAGGLQAIQEKLAQGLGLIMLITIPVGVVMIIRGVIMDKANGEWKWEILKGLVLAGAPMIMNTAFGIFLNQAGIAPTF